jgi:Zn-dependent protease
VASQVNQRVRSHVRIFGIRVRVHWTFLILLAWVFAASIASGRSGASSLIAVALVLTLFACVVLHELGHALVARHFGVRTRDITLYPIGGVARLESIPERPREELMIAAAGPLTNFVIAAVLSIFVAWPRPQEVSILGSNFWGTVLYLNISIGLFNLLPAFPMDGGRMLRAVLALRMDYRRATQIAANAGMALAILLGVTALVTGSVMPLFIAGFVFIAARQEALHVLARSLIQGVAVADAMLKNIQTVDAELTLRSAASKLLSSDQDEFPVLYRGTFAGLLKRSQLLRALSDGDRDAMVESIADTRCDVAEQSEPLDDALRRLQTGPHTTLPVMHAGALVGMLTLEHLANWLALRRAIDGSIRVRADGFHWPRKLSPNNTNT